MMSIFNFFGSILGYLLWFLYTVFKNYGIAIILFTILSGLGYINDGALLAYSLILAINRPIEMLVTALNVVGDSATAIYVAKSEGMLNEDIYNS